MKATSTTRTPRMVAPARRIEQVKRRSVAMVSRDPERMQPAVPTTASSSASIQIHEEDACQPTSPTVGATLAVAAAAAAAVVAPAAVEPVAAEPVAAEPVAAGSASKAAVASALKVTLTPSNHAAISRSSLGPPSASTLVRIDALSHESE